MFKKRLCVLCLSFYISFLVAQTENYLSTSDLINQQGYPYQENKVVTDDNYIIKLDRIPNPDRPVVLFSHGLMTNAGSFVTNEKAKDFAFMLYDNGFDVWLINFRGTSYSPLEDGQSWEFSFDEFGKYDIPAAIKYCLSVTGQSQVILVGHSEGTSSVFTMLSIGEYNSYVKLFVALAPAVYVKHTQCEPIILFDKFKIIDFLHKLGVKSLNGDSFLTDVLTEDICSLPFISDLCILSINSFAGWDLSSVDKKRLNIYVSRSDDSSVHNFEHGIQALNSGNFSHFDYGSEENLKRYGTPYPPLYDLSNVNVPVAFYYGGEDKMVVPEDAKYLLDKLPSSIVIDKMLISNWGHIDFVFNEDNTIWQHMVDVIKKQLD